MVESNELDLNGLLKELDSKHFDDKFCKEKVTLIWSKTMPIKKSRIIKPKDEKPGVIFLSKDNLGTISRDDFKEFKEIVLVLLHKAFKDFDFKDVGYENDALTSQFQKFAIVDKPLPIESHCKPQKEPQPKSVPKPQKAEEPVKPNFKPDIKPKVKFQMDDKIREIERKNIVDKRLEDLDPHPDIQVLFKEYDERFFGGTLNQNEVEVMWSERAFVTAGSTINNFPKPIKITLSRKLLKFEKRSHLVETLIHEMIHAYCFIKELDVKENRSHGESFLHLMNQINDESGANITVFHGLDFIGQEQFLKKEEKHRENLKKANEE